MTLNLKTEIEKINQGCGNLFIDENGNDAPCKLLLVDRVEPEPHLCPSCRAKKQGLIQGAKMVIEEIRRISEEYFNEEYYHDFPKEPFETLKQLNDWLEKE